MVFIVPPPFDRPLRRRRGDNRQKRRIDPSGPDELRSRLVVDFQVLQPHLYIQTYILECAACSPPARRGQGQTFPLRRFTGGTFDHLHMGHKILLSMGAWISRKVYVDVTGP
jgi:hypothetical protein